MPKYTLPPLQSILPVAEKAKGAAPEIMTRSGLSDLSNYILGREGTYGAQRVERAADEIPNLEKLYTQEALRRAFSGDNARALMTMKPSDFEKYAAPLESNLSDESVKNISDLINVQKNGGFSDVPFLMVNKEQQGLESFPWVTSHEGRHRNRAMDAAGEQAGLVQFLPRAELREPFPRRSQEQYIEAIRKEMDLSGNRIKPEAYYLNDLDDQPFRRPSVKLPDLYAEGGLITDQQTPAVEAIKDTVRDPQAARMLDMDLARLAVMNPPQRMASGGAVNHMDMRRVHMADGGLLTRLLHGSPTKIKPEVGRFIDTTTQKGYALKRAADKMDIYGQQGPGYLNQFDVPSEKLIRFDTQFTPDQITQMRKTWSKIPADTTSLMGEDLYDLATQHGVGHDTLMPHIAKSIDYAGYQRLPTGTGGKDEWFRITNPDYLQRVRNEAHGGVVRMAGGGDALKAVMGALNVLPKAEREANLAKFLENSAVKDRLYHGTTSDITQFDPNKSRSKTGNINAVLGTFMSDNPAEANRYASEWGATGGNVMPVYTSLKNPYHASYKEMDDLAMGTYRRMLQDPEFDPNKTYKGFDKEGQRKTFEMIEKHEPAAIQDAHDFKNKLIESGHDGIIWNLNGNREIIAFDPKQIKSATSNVGTYDTTNPDITKAHGGAVHMADGGQAEMPYGGVSLENLPERNAFSLNSKPASQAYSGYDVPQIDASGKPMALPKTSYDMKLDMINNDLAKGIKPDWMSFEDFAQDQVSRGRGTGHILPAVMKAMSFPYEMAEKAIGSSMGIDPMMGMVGKTGELHAVPGAARYMASRALPEIKDTAAMAADLYMQGKMPGMVAPASYAAPPTSGGKLLTPVEIAHQTAQRNAALPIEQGGLGLHPENTAMDRAKAMGIDTDVYHGSKQNIEGGFEPGYDDNLAFVTQNPEFANKWIGKGKYNERAGEEAKAELKSAEDKYRQIKSKHMDYDTLNNLEGDEFTKEYDRRNALAKAEQQKEFGMTGYPTIHNTVYPMKVRANKTFNPETDMHVMQDYFDENKIPQKVIDLYKSGNYMMYETKPVVEYLKKKGYDSMRLRESTGDDYPTIAVFDPAHIRSRFAAFDPMLQHESGLLKAKGGKVSFAGDLDAMRHELTKAK